MTLDFTLYTFLSGCKTVTRKHGQQANICANYRQKYPKADIDMTYKDEKRSNAGLDCIKSNESCRVSSSYINEAQIHRRIHFI